MNTTNATAGLVRIEALIRPTAVDRVVHALRDAGALRVTVMRGHAVGVGADPATARPSLEEGTTSSDVALVHVVCSGELAPTLTAALVAAAHTGHPGDGIVVESPASSVINIGTGETGERALR